MNPDTKRLITKGLYIAGSILVVITLAIKEKLPWTQKIKSEPVDSPKPLSAAG